MATNANGICDMTGISTRPGIIHRNGIYTLAEFKLRTGLSDSALRSARRKGFRTILAHGRKYILGRDWHRYLEMQTPSNETTTLHRVR